MIGCCRPDPNSPVYRRGQTITRRVLTVAGFGFLVLVWVVSVGPDGFTLRAWVALGLALVMVGLPWWVLTQQRRQR